MTESPFSIQIDRIRARLRVAIASHRVGQFLATTLAWRPKSTTLRQLGAGGALSVRILQHPRSANGRLHKGAIILNHVDEAVRLFPPLRDLFFLIERHGWYGINKSRIADIKFVEDGSMLEVSQRLFPRAIMLELSGADFVDESVFRPLSMRADYHVIQISCWSRRKRIELLLQAAAKLPHLSFVHLGHFEQVETSEAITYRKECLAWADRWCPNVAFPFRHAGSNADIPTRKEEINVWLNRAQLGVLTSAAEGVNRFKTECLASDRPFLVPSDAVHPTRKHINPLTGSFFNPTADALADAITSALATREQFQPRKYLLENSGHGNSLPKLKNALRELCRRNEQAYDFDNIDWDGRNDNLLWGLPAIDCIRGVMEQFSAVDPSASPRPR